MKRAFAILCGTVLLTALLPATASAGKATKFTDHHVGAFCETPVEGGFVSAGIDSSSEFGQFGGASVWLDPAVEFEDPAAISGSSETAEVVEGDPQVLLSSTFDVFDPDGNPLGEASLALTMHRVGDPEPLEPFPNNGNHKFIEEGTSQSLEGTGVLTLPDGEIALPSCSGDITDRSLFETNPTAFVSANQGVGLDCFWETDEARAFLSVTDDTFGFRADAGVATATLDVFSTSSTGSIDASSMAAEMELVDDFTGDTYTASAEATFSPIGTPVKSTLTGSKSRVRVLEQALDPAGSLDFSADLGSFQIDDEHCNASTFDNHALTTQPKGPKSGPAPANDTPDGAIALAPGSRLNTSNVGASVDAEAPIETCPEGQRDNMGRTLWYAIEGTGGPITIDTAGSNFDTLIGVYVDDGGSLTEVACIDDVFYEPIGSSYQAALTLDTEDGVTYLVQIGGFFDPIFGDGIPQVGRLRLAVN